MRPKVAGVVPARLGSTRFPEKVLARVGDVPMVVAVARQAMKAKTLAEVLVATDHPRVYEVCAAAGVSVLMTREDHPSGTDRLAEVAKKRKDFTHIVNVQGDEPLMDPRLIDQVAKRLLEHPEAVVTASCPLEDEEEWRDPNAVKVLTRKDGRALIFSRSPIPFPRSGDAMLLARKHIGIYGYERSLLLWFAKQKPQALETTEALEQLRLMVLGKELWVVPTNYRPHGVDTQEDLKRVNALLKKGMKP